MGWDATLEGAWLLRGKENQCDTNYLGSASGILIEDLTFCISIPESMQWWHIGLYC